MCVSEGVGPGPVPAAVGMQSLVHDGERDVLLTGWETLT